jgi:hypothetical protein
MTQEQLETIVSEIQKLLWWNNRTEAWDPDLEWDSESLEYVSGVLSDAGLKPEGNGRSLPAAPVVTSEARSNTEAQERLEESV